MNHHIAAILLAISIAFSTHAQNLVKPTVAQIENPTKSPGATAAKTVQAKPDEFSADAYINKIYQKSYVGKENEITDFSETFYNQVTNPYPYIYALWFNRAVVGNYGKKQYNHQLKLLDKILNDSRAHGTLIAAAHYQKGMHHVFSNDFEQGQREFDQIGNIKNWQYVGPFENLSQSGFYKNYGPLEHPEPTAEFISASNAKVKWFTPALENQDGWSPVRYQFHKTTGVVYAQTFVQSNSDQEIYCNVGAGGAIKVWINDALVISEYKERITEMDTYTAKYRLQKGVNRVLVQLSFTNMDYANFGVRFTDKSHRPIPGLIGSNVYKRYNKAVAPPIEPLKHFAETFFKEKIESDPANIVNYLLLTDVYMRNRKTLEARHLLEDAIKLEPSNNILRMKLLEVLLREDNRSVMLEELAKLRQADPKALVLLEYDIQDAISNERLDDAVNLVNERESLYGEDLNTVAYRLGFLMKQKKFNEVIALAEAKYQEHPNASFLVRIMHAIKKEAYRDPQGALKIYEDFLTTNYDWALNREYINYLKEDGQHEKSYERRKFVTAHFSYDPDVLAELANYHFVSKEYKAAAENLEKALKLSPYNEKYWDHLGDVEQNQEQVAKAIEAYNKSLLFNPNQYDVINKLRKLKGKSETYQLVPLLDIDDIIRRDDPEEAKPSEFGYYVIHEDKCAILHPGGAVEDYNTYIVRITNEKGIDDFKESRIDYNSNQTLLIEQSEVVKKSGAKIKGERNQNVVVFPNLEVGDVIVFRYRFQRYAWGRFQKDYWEKQFFGNSVYVARTRYTLLAPPTQKINYLITNSSLKPIIKDVEDFKQYTWESVKNDPMKVEPLMPTWVDVAPVLHISTVSDWNAVATWYGDMVNNVSDESYEVTKAFNDLFPQDEVKKLTEFEKARRIYEFIQANIRYSSVSFRQSAYLPQRAFVTLTTRLGDCKDLSNLFVTLCKMAKIEARMVLVDTRDNGSRDMILPSLNFNHCIAKAKLDGREYYIELTDSYLPFASLPNNLVNALILEIPRKGETLSSDLKPLVSTTKKSDVAKAIIKLTADGTDLVVNVTSTKSGALSSAVRAQYNNLSYTKQFEKVEQLCASNYKNVEMDTVAFSELKNLDDSVSMHYQFRIKDEIAEIGSLRTFKLPFIDVVASLNRLSAGKRNYPIDYNSYEDADAYSTVIIVEPPNGKKIVELPANEKLAFGGMQYELTYKVNASGNLEVTRSFSSNRREIPASDYANFRAFVEKIVKAEQRIIAFQ